MNLENKQITLVEPQNPLYRVTSVSKYLAMVLLIAMPFIGGWIGYEYAPEKIVVVEKIVVKETINTDPIQTDSSVSEAETEEAPIGETTILMNEGSVKVTYSNSELHLNIAPSLNLNVRYPNGWEINRTIQNETANNTLARIDNPKTPGAPDSDVPREFIMAQLREGECQGELTKVSDKLSIHDTGWKADGFIEGSFDRTMCIKGSPLSLELYFRPLGKETEVVMDRIINAISVY